MADLTEVQDAMYDALVADATLQGLTGYTASDVRVYAAWPRKMIAIDAGLPAYVVLHTVSLGAPVFDREDMTFQVSIFAAKQSTCLSVLNAVDAVLHKSALTATNHWLLTMTRRDTQHDFEMETGRHHLAVTYSVMVIDK